MALKTITSLGTLMRLANILGKARQSGDEEAIAEALKNHDAYRDACLEADELHTGMTYGQL